VPDDCLSPQRAAALRDEVRRTYRAVASQPEGLLPYPTGRASALRLGYPPAWLHTIPHQVVDRFVGVGNPFGIRKPATGEHVLDIGCGCGLDSFVAAALVGPEGRSVGLDLTVEMLDQARAAQANAGLGNLEFREGTVEALPFDDASFDQVISNGVLNLVPDKDAAFREIARVLRPGGVFAAADLLVTATIPEQVLSGIDAWST